MSVNRIALSLAFLALALTTACVTTPRNPPVQLTEVQWQGVGCYRIEMPMGTVYFEKDNGVSGFKSFIDREGRDWIASHLPPAPSSGARGFPNTVGGFGHAGRNSGSTNHVLNGKTEGDCVIVQSSNTNFTFQYWFFADHIAIKVLRSKGDYSFLLECVAGGAIDTEDYFVTPDGQRHVPKGKFKDLTPEWLYIGDIQAANYLFLAKTPDDDAPNENHRHISSRTGQQTMDLYSFGRAGKEDNYEIRGMNGNEHVCILGFIPDATPHEKIKSFVEGMMARPFEPAVR
jgi:hypothetical protein